MKFNKDYSKLNKQTFTTIRKASYYYHIRGIYKIKTPTKEFKAMAVARHNITKENINERLAQCDADCLRAELIDMLEKWYGKNFDDFILLTLRKEE